MERYKSQFMESYIKDLKTSIISLTKILKQYKIHFTFIGGAARNQYKYQKITEDLDLLIAKNDKEKIKDIPIGFLKDISHGRGKRFKLHSPETLVEFIYEGEISGDGVHGISFEYPDKVSTTIDGVPYLTLENLIKYKLSSGIYGQHRYKDFDDIIELIKRNKLSKTFAKNFRDDLKNKYIFLWDESQNKDIFE